MNYLISQYPVTHDYLDRLSEITGTPLQSVVVSTITAQGHLAILRRFRALKCDVVYIPAIDASALPLLAPLRILSMLVRTRRRFVVRPDYSLREFGFFDAFWGGLRMTWGMLSGFFEAYRDWRYLGKILKAPRRLCSGTTDNRVLYINTNLWLGIQAGGAVAHISGVVKGLLDKGHEVLFASVEAPVALPASKMLATHRISPRNTYVIPRDLNHYRHNPLFFDALSPLFRSPIGFIYQRLSLGSFAGVMLSRHHGVPLVIEYNGSEKWLANNWGSRLNLEKLAMRAENACLRHAHLVVTVSDVLKQDLIDRGVDPERVVFHPNGVDPDLFDPQRFTKNDIAELRKSYGISADSLVVTFVGTFGPWHGAEVFARSVAELAAKDREWLKALKLHFFFIGDGARRRNVEDFIARKRIQQFVSVTGLIDQEKTPQHLAASDILVSPHVYNPDGSPFFGSPTKLFEYLAATRPVIASDLGQIGEVLDGCPHVGELDGTQGFPDEACGILVKPESSGELTAAIRLLAENQKWRNTAGLNAHARALNRYTWGHHVKAVVDGLDRVRALDATAPRPRVRVLFNGLHSKSGGGLTYLKNILPLMADDPDIDLHLCVHEDQRTFLPDAMENITIHYLNFKQGFWNLQVREQIYIPRLAKQIGASATFSPANYGPLWAPNPVVLLRNALSVAFVERRPVKLAYWALVYVGTILSLLTSRRAITVSDYARRAAGGGV
ncbi:MAG: glycosyltransferase, partial [Rhodospirillales bacterium]|nr:glycosyltransferase [Rhodospirillales bacterium]